MQQRKPSREVCAMWLWDTVNHAAAGVMVRAFMRRLV